MTPVGPLCTSMSTALPNAAASASFWAETRIRAEIRASGSAWVTTSTLPWRCSTLTAAPAGTATVFWKSRRNSCRSSFRPASAGDAARAAARARPVTRSRRSIEVLLHELLEGPLLLPVDGEQLPAQVRVEPVALDLGPALRDRGVDQRQLLAIRHQQRRVGPPEPGFGHLGQRVDRPDVGSLRLLHVLERLLRHEALRRELCLDV